MLGGLGIAEGIRVALPYAFVADRTGFLRIVRVADPDAPMLVASVSIPGAPVSLAVHEHIVAVAAQAGGVSLVNVANPVAPFLISTISAPAAALGIDFDVSRALAA